MSWGMVSTLLNRVVFVVITGLLKDAGEDKYRHTKGQHLRKSVTVLTNNVNAFLSHSFQHKSWLIFVRFLWGSSRQTIVILIIQVGVDIYFRHPWADSWSYGAFLTQHGHLLHYFTACIWCHMISYVTLVFFFMTLLMNKVADAIIPMKWVKLISKSRKPKRLMGLIYF